MKSSRGVYSKLINIVLFFCFTLLFVYDYFPSVSQLVGVPKMIIIFLFIGLFFVGLLYNRNKNDDSKEVLKWQISSTLYILFLMALFTVLGGESTSGISFSNKFFWIVLILPLYNMYSQWNKFKGTDFTKPKEDGIE